MEQKRSILRYVIFTGPSQAGKSTLASLLSSEFRSRGLTAMNDSFEMPMKHYLAMLFGQKLSLLPMEKPISELLSRTPRDFLNREAAHMRFSYGPGVLGKLLATRAKRWQRQPRYIIIDDGTSILDCRELGRYFLVHVNRDRVERVYPFSIPNAEMVVYNDGTLEKLKLWAVKIADRVIADETGATP